MSLLSLLLMNGAGVASAAPQVAWSNIGTTSVNPTTTVDVVNDGSAGQLCILFLLSRAETGPLDPTLTPPAGFQSIENDLNTVDVAVEAWWKILDGTEGANFTLTTSASSTGLAAVAVGITGYGSVPIHVSGKSNSGGVNNAVVTYSDLVTTDNDCLILRFLGFTVVGGGTNSSTLAGYTELEDGHSTNAAGVRRGAAAYRKELAVAGSTGAEVGAIASARLWSSISVAITPFIPAPSVGPNRVTPIFTRDQLAIIRRRRR